MGSVEGEPVKGVNMVSSSSPVRSGTFTGTGAGVDIGFNN